MPDDWPFDEARNVACFTTHAVLGGSPILEVYHDYEDGAWQFHAADTGEPALVALEEIYERDPSIGDLHDLECGWRAIRANPGDSWNRSLSHPYPTYAKHGFYLDNAAELAKIFPDTFSIPPEDERMGIKEGDFVKLMFSFIPEGQEPKDYDCERMWVIAKEDCDGHWKGILDNDPQFHEAVSSGAELCFHPDHIIAIERLTKAYKAALDNPRIRKGGDKPQSESEPRPR
ncbi:DUF2314 domain-containing protein [Haloferula sargassicola]